MQVPGRASFERPYGLAWLLALAAELRSWDDPRGAALVADPRAARGRSRAAPAHLAAEVALPDPRRRTQPDRVRASAWSTTGRARRGDADMQRLIETRSRDYYGKDMNCPLAYEPSGEDFLSPCLAEADLMRRILPPPDYAHVVAGFPAGHPDDRARRWLAPGVVTDRSDPKLAHIDGLNLSRAWMLQGIASGLPPGDRAHRGR